MIWNREIEQVKVKWKQFGPDEATWEMVDNMRVMYPSLFDAWAYVFNLCYLVHVYAYVYYIYCNELCYKAQITSIL